MPIAIFQNCQQAVVSQNLDRAVSPQDIAAIRQWQDHGTVSQEWVTQHIGRPWVTKRAEDLSSDIEVWALITTLTATRSLDYADDLEDRLTAIGVRALSQVKHLAADPSAPGHARASAIRILEAIDIREAIPLAISGADDRDARVRHAAAECLSSAPVSTLAQAALDRLAEDESEVVRQAARDRRR